MGIIYTLVKRDVPEAFDLGKGPWDIVFERKHGFSFFANKNGNFEESFKIEEAKLRSNIKKFGLERWSIDNDKLVRRITSWAKDSEIFLINYWEEIESLQEENDRENFDFHDLDDFLVASLFDYKITASIWEDK
jgi:hypothetical protein